MTCLLSKRCSVCSEISVGGGGVMVEILYGFKCFPVLNIIHIIGRNMAGALRGLTH